MEGVGGKEGSEGEWRVREAPVISINHCKQHLTKKIKLHNVQKIKE